jgi:hypothetical protein
VQDKPIISFLQNSGEKTGTKARRGGKDAINSGFLAKKVYLCGLWIESVVFFFAWPSAASAPAAGWTG